jgi:hypothetical protein
MAIFATFQMPNIENKTCIPCDAILLKINTRLQKIPQSDNLTSLYGTFYPKRRDFDQNQGRHQKYTSNITKLQIAKFYVELGSIMYAIERRGLNWASFDISVIYQSIYHCLNRTQFTFMKFKTNS